MHHAQFAILRLEIAFWGLLLMSMLAPRWWLVGFALFMAAVCRYGIWDLGRDHDGPGFWDKVWRR